MQEDISAESLRDYAIDSSKVKKGSTYYESIQAYHKKAKEAEQANKDKQQQKSLIRKLIPRKNGIEYIDYEDRVKAIKSMLEKGSQLMEKNLHAAATMYEALQPLYKELPEPLKSEIYPKIYPFYKELERRINERREASAAKKT